MAKARYFSECGGITTGVISNRVVRYPAGVFEVEKGDLGHCAEVESYTPNKNPDHYLAGKRAGWIVGEEESEPVAPAYPTTSMKAARPRRKGSKRKAK